ncbi:MAG TPA: choice-of-anchor Q domain-containing protein [Verrucomicrobiae bacterium]|nr:choice-of-anchor Q domain-containing protein [Verrucomicrobiae bacterium]
MKICPRLFPLVLTTAIATTCFALTAGATTYYVDYAAGSDSNAGTSTGAAWKHCPGDPAASGNPLSQKLQPNDTILFKGGVRYVFTSANSTGILLNNASGTLGNPVTFDGNSAGAWGTGKAVLTDNNSNPGHNAFYSSAAVSNIVIRNFVITQLGGSATLPPDTGAAVAANWGAGVNLSATALNITVQDCDLSMLGYWYNQKPMSAGSIDGMGIDCFPNMAATYGNILVTNCNFSRMAQGCNFSAGPTLTNITVANCSFTDSIMWCVDINVRTTGTFTDYITVHDCKFYDYYQFNQDYWTGYGGWPHTDGIFFRVDYSGASFGTHNNFYNNKFYYTKSSGGGTAQMYITEGPSCNIYNNVFIGSGLANGNVVIGDGPLDGSNNQLVRVFNNTFYDSYTFDVSLSNENAPSRPIGKVWMANNIFYDAMLGSGNNFVAKFDTGTIPWTWGVTNWFINNNLYKSFNGTGNYLYAPKVWGEGNITSMQAYGWEKNGVVADPLFLNITLGLANASSTLNDLRLQTNSPAIGAGTNLTALAAVLPGLDKDIAGNPRPAVGGWSIGAYEASTSGVGGGGGGGGLQLPPVVSAITQSGADVNTNTAGPQVFAGSVVQYSATASDPNSLPLTWQWSYSVNGGADTVVQTGVGAVGSVSFNYTAAMAGSTFVWKLAVNNGLASATSTLTVGVVAPPSPTAGLSFQAADATVTAPFALSGGAIGQSVQTVDPTLGGQAVFSFYITNAGNYVIQAVVSAPNDANNSFFVNVDGQPVDPTMIWDIPLTSGFEQRIVSWRGSGSDGNNEFVPAVFNLTAGAHQLIVRGREAYVSLQSVAILNYLSPPQNLRIIPQ